MTVRSRSDVRAGYLYVIDHVAFIVYVAQDDVPSLVLCYLGLCDGADIVGGEVLPHDGDM